MRTHFLSLALLVSLLFITGITFGQRRVYNCLDFDGINDVVRTKATSVTNLKNSAITVEAWVNPTSFNLLPYEGVVVARYQEAGNRGFVLGVGGNGQVYFGVHDDSSAEITSKINTIETNKWTHLAGSFDRYCLRLYVNGQLTDSLIDSTAVGDAIGLPFTMGNIHSLSRPYHGKIDEVRLWSRALSGSEIAQNYQSSFCGFSTDLKAYFRFNKGNPSGNNSVYFRVPDWSLYNEEGTLYNFKLSGTNSNYLPGMRHVQEAISSVDTVIACDFYRSPSRLFTYTKSGVYHDTVYSKLGCDSAIKIVLTIRKSSRDTLHIRSCGTYQFPSGKNSTSISGVFTDIIPNAQNCDSVLTLIVQIGPDTTMYDTTVCQSFVLPHSKRMVITSGTYVDTLTNRIGCDSFIFYNVQVLPAGINRVQRDFCDSFYLTTSSRWVTSEGWYKDTLVNYAGCDSIVEYQLKSMVTRAFFQDYACGSYVSPSGKYVWTQSGKWFDTLVNVMGCDSIIEVNLEVSPVTDTVLYIQACRSYRAPSRRFFIHNSGTYYDTVMNAWGCDSVIRIEATIIHFETDLQESGDSLFAWRGYDTYQWLRCDNAYAIVPNETKHYLLTKEPGEYAVRMEKDGCADTSECVTIAQNGISVFQNVKFEIYPNPNDGKFYIDGDNLDASFVEVRDMSGRIHQVISFMDGFDDKREVRIDQAGLYYLILFKGNYREVISVLVNP